MSLGFTQEDAREEHAAAPQAADLEQETKVPTHSRQLDEYDVDNAAFRSACLKYLIWRICV